MIYWFIGQPGSGKTTLARRLKNRFDQNKSPAIHLDGDDLRVIFGNTYSKKHFTKKYRTDHTRQLQRFVAYLADQGITIIVSTVNAYKDVREEFKASRNDVTEIYVTTSEARGREDKWVEDFERPEFPFIAIITGMGVSEDQSFDTLCNCLLKKQYICTMISNVTMGTYHKTTTKVFYDEKEREKWASDKQTLADHGGFPAALYQERMAIP